ncbi:hypothetical protein STVIR_8129 [Streptomyces viridochromogenes Tue57]|uniref:Uncharacterized protein n=1 Tax=Streptomyces viridochromogenes Tue57 TaxID=1160705 RepID=L8P018_STRVR|nr:hypothetical protein STVIR_8129 [Streptomyces viridochromogenes Tue57]
MSGFFVTGHAAHFKPEILVPAERATTAATYCSSLL